jgi:hypothetical protein
LGKAEKKEKKNPEEMHKTSIQISTDLRDRLWKLKFRKTYEDFLLELCDLFEEKEKEKEAEKEVVKKEPKKKAKKSKRKKK